MAYFLEALITRGNWLSAVQLPSCARIVPLLQDVFLVPIADELLGEEVEKPATALPPSFEALARRLSLRGPVAYVSAGFFGGHGGQTSCIWLNEKLILGPLRELGAINQALRRLGVEKNGAHDEFDAVGLGRHRHTEDWQ